jgi:hypothetical protein
VPRDVSCNVNLFDLYVAPVERGIIVIPYRNRRLESCPDVGDCQSEARKFSAGGADYNRNRRFKAAKRRNMKRSDKQRAQREFMEDLQTATNSSTTPASKQASAD